MTYLDYIDYATGETKFYGSFDTVEKAKLVGRMLLRTMKAYKIIYR
jgi:hypothetical protein